MKQIGSFPAYREELKRQQADDGNSHPWYELSIAFGNGSAMVKLRIPSLKEIEELIHFLDTPEGRQKEEWILLQGYTLQANNANRTQFQQLQEASAAVRVSDVATVTYTEVHQFTVEIPVADYEAAHN